MSITGMPGHAQTRPHKTASSGGGYGPPPSTWLLGTPRVHSPSGISIGSSVLAPLTLTALGVCVCVCLCVCLSQLRALQKRLNRSRCRSRYGLGGHAHTHTHPFNGPLSGTTRVSWYQKGKTNLDFTEARDSERQ